MKYKYKTLRIVRIVYNIFALTKSSSACEKVKVYSKLVNYPGE